MNHEKAIVISHERSGTHLLINTLAANFGFFRGRIDLDGQGIDWSAPGELERFLRRFEGKQVKSVLKSHHPFEVFEPCLDMLVDQFKVFYIYRDGRDVMTSFWRFLNQLGWDEGPKRPSVSAFIRCKPRGQLLRYEAREHESMVERWVDHVRCWVERAPHDVITMSYEELMEDFEHTVTAKITPVFGRAPRGTTVVMPTLEDHSVLPWRGQVGTWRAFFEEDDERFFETEAGALMRCLGYDLPPRG